MQISADGVALGSIVDEMKPDVEVSKLVRANDEGASEGHNPISRSRVTAFPTAVAESAGRASIAATFLCSHQSLARLAAKPAMKVVARCL